MFITVSFSQENAYSSFDVSLSNSIRLNRFLINPAFSYARETAPSINLVNKRQWVKFEDSPVLYLLNYQGRLSNESRFGIGVYSQSIGLLKNNGGILNYALNVPLESDSNLTFGINTYVSSTNFDVSSAITESPEPLLQNQSAITLISLKPGINLNFNSFDIGIAANNVISYNLNESQTVKENKSSSFSGHLMYTKEVSSYYNILDGSNFSSMLQVQNANGATGLSGNFLIDQKEMGWLEVGYNTLYGANAGIGVAISKKFLIGYAYNLSISNSLFFGSSHEFSLSYRFTEYDDSFNFRKRAQALRDKNAKKKKPANATFAKLEEERLAKAKAERERVAKESLAQAQAERDRIALEKAEKERLAREKAEADRLAKEQAEADRIAREQAEKDRLAKEAAENNISQAEKDRLAKEQAEADRLAREQAEKDRLAREKAEKDRLAREQAERDRLAREATTQAEKDRLAREQAEKDKLAKEAAAQAEKDRLAREQAEKDRLAKEKADNERLAREQAERDRLAREATTQAEKDRLAREQAEKDKLAKEAAAQAEKDRLAREQAEKDRLAKEKAEKDRLAREQAERDRLAREATTQAEKDRLAREQAEKDRLAKEAAAQAEKDRLAKEQAEKDRLAKEAAAKAEKDRLAKEAAAQAEKDRLAREQAEKDRLAKEALAQAEKDKLAKEAAAQAEKDRLAREQAEKDRLAKEAAAKAEKDRLAREQAEKDKLAKEAAAQAEKDRLARELAEKDRLAKEAAAKAEKDRLAKEAAAKAEKDRLVREQAEKDRLAKEAANSKLSVADKISNIESKLNISNKVFDDYKSDISERTKNSDKLIKRLDSIVNERDLDLKAYIAEDDPNYKGAPRKFVSTTQQNAQLNSLKSEISSNKKVFDDLIFDFENANRARLAELKASGASEEDAKLLNQYYQSIIDDLKSKKQKYIDLEKLADQRILKINADKEEERQRRIKKAVYSSEQERILNDQKNLENIKNSTNSQNQNGQQANESSVDDEPVTNDISIVKKMNNVASGYYMVLGKFKDTKERDNFIKQVVSEGGTSVNQFYNIHDGIYYVYLGKYDDLSPAINELNKRGTKNYNKKMRVVKVE